MLVHHTTDYLLYTIPIPEFITWKGLETVTSSQTLENKLIKIVFSLEYTGEKHNFYCHDISSVSALSFILSVSTVMFHSGRKEKYIFFVIK